jgi:hypothetical protein
MGGSAYRAGHYPVGDFLGEHNGTGDGACQAAVGAAFSGNSWRAGVALVGLLATVFQEKLSGRTVPSR